MAARRRARSGRPPVVMAWFGAVALLGALGACSAGDAASTADDATTTTVPALRWAALGDSYSAGYGGSRSRVIARSGAATAGAGPAACLQADPDSYARRAVELLAPHPVELTLVACGGARSSDLPAQLATAGPAGLTDVATVTVGGNDLGFGELIRQCSGGLCPDLAADRADLPGVPGAPGDPGRIAGSGGSGGTGATDWELLGDGLAARFGDLAGWLRPGGTLLVLTYPLPFPEQPGACPTGVGLNRPEDATLVNAAIVRLDDTLVAAAASAAREHADRTIAVVEWRTPDGTAPTSDRTAADGSIRRVGWNPAGICGSDPMLNGLRLDGELSDSFHPSDRGLDLAAAAVIEPLRRLTGR